MGVDFSAVFQHSFDFTSIEHFKVELVKEVRFPHMTRCIKEVNEHNPHLKRQWSLTRERIIESYRSDPFDPVVIGDEEYIQVDGPGGFSFIFNRFICEFSPCFRWYSFIENPELQLEIRNICKEIADYFGYHFAIYMGDNYCALDYVFEGRDMDYYKTALKRRFGPSKTTINELIEKSESGWKSKGYFVDYFKEKGRGFGEL